MDAPGEEPIRLALLRLPVLELPGGRALQLAPNDAALLALLALDGPAARARVATLIWPGVADDKARNNLRQRLFRWRRATGRTLVTQGEVLALAPGLQHDLDAPAAALMRDPAARQGELLEGLDYGDGSELGRWVQAARERWRALRRDALEEAAARLDAAGHGEAALACLERLVHDEPLLEHAHRGLIRLHYHRGDRAAALAAYESLCAQMARRFQRAPARETQELAALVEAGVSLPGPAALR